jgi:DNA-directed RNA polymerase subunit RPC12/RpoP
VIELPEDDDPAAVKAMVEFFYTENYESPGDKSKPAQEDQEIPTSTISTPKKLSAGQMKVLRRRSAAKAPFSSPEPECIVCEPENVIIDLVDGQIHPLLFHLAVYELADRIQLVDLKSLAEDKFGKMACLAWQHTAFSDAIRKVYDIAPPGSQGDELRDIVIAVAARHAKALFNNDSFSQMVREVNEFSADLNKALCGHTRADHVVIENPTNFLCAGCGTRFSFNVPSGQQYVTCPVCSASKSMGQWGKRI